MNIAILGCGPSGLMAAQAARELGATATVLSIKQKSEILGGQYLHISVPGITGKADEVTYIKMGDAKGYSQKVYGKPDVPCFRFPDGQYPAWSLTEAYDNLWGVWESLIRHQEVGPDDVAGLCERFDKVICTLPRPMLCYKDDHVFRKQDIHVCQGISLIDKDIKNVVMYSGREADNWYRTSNLFGHETTEWSMSAEAKPLERAFWPHKEKIKRGHKPLDTDCDCHDGHDNFHRTGRFGEWGHGILISDAYEQTKTVLAEEFAWRS